MPLILRDPFLSRVVCGGTPSSAIFGPAHGFLVEAVLSGNMCPYSARSPYFGKDFRGNFGAMVFVSEGWHACFPASLANHVVGVVLMGPQEQVVNVDAGWIVTGMANQHPIGDGTALSQPHFAVGQLELVLVRQASVAL